MSPGGGLFLLCDRPLGWVGGARDFARDFALYFGRGAGASSGIAAVCMAWPRVVEGCRREYGS